MAIAVEPVEVRAANLRRVVEEKVARVEAIGVELVGIAEEIRAVRAQAVADNPTGELRAGPRGVIRKLADQAAQLTQERNEIEALLPDRTQVLERLEQECRDMGIEELRGRRALIDADIRANLGVVGEQFRGMVETWAGPFLTSVQALVDFNWDVKSKRLERVPGLIGSPIEVYPTDVLRLVELLLAAAGISESNPSPGFIAASGLREGEDVAGPVLKAQARFQGLDVEKTSWLSMHGESQVRAN